MTPDVPSRPVPRPLIVAALVVLLAGVAMLLVGALRTGVTTDEPYHVQRFEHYLANGWYIVDFQSYDGKPGEGVKDQYVYGPATMLLLHGWNRALGIDGPGHVATSADAYAARHLGVALLSLVGVAAVAALTRLVLRSWAWGIVAAAILCATPMWLGHSMFNVKDPSAAVGYTLITLGVALIARRDRGPFRLSLAAVASLMSGTWLAVGTRPGLWAAVVASVAALLTLTVLRPREHGERGLGWRSAELATALVPAALLLWWTYPRVFGHPLTMLLKSTSGSANFLGIESSRLYVPLHVLLLVPILILAFTILGVVTSLRRLLRARLRTDVADARTALVGVQLVALPTVTLIHPSGLYGDLRQFLFMMPAAAVLAAVGLARALAHTAKQSDRRLLPMAALAGVLAVVVPLADQATLFPYNYGYYNVLVEVAHARDVAPLDYYKASMRELAADVPDHGWLVCNPLWRLDHTVMRVARLDGAVDCATAQTSPVQVYLDQQGRTSDSGSSDVFWALMVNGEVPKNCTRSAEVTRRHGWRKLAMSALVRCRFVADHLSEKAMSTSTELDPFLFEGWYVGGRAVGSRAILAFTPSEDLSRAAGALVLDVDGSPALDVEVDGQPVDALAGDHRIEVPVPASSMAASTAEKPILVELSGRSGASLDLTLDSLRLVAAS